MAGAAARRSGPRAVNAARTNHFVIDEPAYNGGPGEAITPAESFLAGVSACGVLLVESFAHQANLPVKQVETSIEGRRSRSEPNRFIDVTMQFRISGVSQADAQRLVEQYQGR